MLRRAARRLDRLVTAPRVRAYAIILLVTQVPLARWLHLPVGPLALWWGLLALLACQAGARRAPPDAEAMRQNVATA